MANNTFFSHFSSACAINILLHSFQDCGGSHFEYRPLAELAVTFERDIGANFSLKWFRNLSNQSRKKVGKNGYGITKNDSTISAVWQTNGILF